MWNLIIHPTFLFYIPTYLETTFSKQSDKRIRATWNISTDLLALPHPSSLMDEHTHPWKETCFLMRCTLLFHLFSVPVVHAARMTTMLKRVARTTCHWTFHFTSYSLLRDSAKDKYVIIFKINPLDDDCVEWNGSLLIPISKALQTDAIKYFPLAFLFRSSYSQFNCKLYYISLVVALDENSAKIVGVTLSIE